MKTLKLIVPGASSDEIVKGLAAAKAVFERAGVTPDRAADARFAVEGWDIGGFVGPIDNDDLDICDVWEEAEQAAIRACCSGRDEADLPADAYLQLVPD